LLGHKTPEASGGASRRHSLLGFYKWRKLIKQKSGALRRFFV